MSILLRKSAAQIKCALGGHTVSLGDEEQLYASKDGRYETICIRCKYPIALELDTKHKDQFYIVEE